MIQRLVLFVFFFGTIACETTDLTTYPWALTDQTCETIYTGRRTPSYQCVVAKGTIQPTDGTEIGPNDWTRVKFTSDGGSIELNSSGPTFSISLNKRHIRLANEYYWSAWVRSYDDGKIKYHTSSTQQFQPNAPIVIFVDPID